MGENKGRNYIKEMVSSGTKELGNRAKYALKQAYKINPALFMQIVAIIIIVLIVLVTIIGIVVDIEDTEEQITTDESQTTIGKDYVVNTAISEKEIIITDSMTLKNAINSLSCSEQAKANINNNMNHFLNIQSQYNVNAVFAISVTLAESSGGTAWDLIDPSTNNWFSLKVGGSWAGETYYDIQGTAWKSYNSFEDAIYDFAELISGSSYYFGGENYTVSSIAPSYCNEEWGIRVIDHMTSIFEACGVDTSRHVSASVTGTAIVNKARQLYKRLYTENFGYSMGTAHEYIPHGTGTCLDYNSPGSSSAFRDGGGKMHGGITDCSAFVDWVLIELGEPYGEKAYATAQWGNDLRAGTLQAKGWQIFNLQTEQDYNKIQPGDIWLNIGEHMFIIGDVYYDSNGVIQAQSFDAGNENTWLQNYGNPTQSYFISQKYVGPNYWIIRISNFN